MRTFLPLAASLLFATGAIASEATVNAAESRKPIAPTIYNGMFGDEMQQAQLAASYAINLPNGELAKVALLGTFGQKSVTGVFSEAPLPPAQGAAIALYTNYDGQGSAFGDTSIQTVTSNPLLSVFASFDLDGKVTVVMLNKSQMASDAVVLGFKGIGQKGDWRAFELKADGTIVPAGNGTIYDAVLTRTVQPYSAVLVEFKPVGGILPIRVTPPAEVTVPAAQVLETESAPQTMGCSVADAGVMSLAMLALLGLMRRRSVR
jgi:MYXO-CTERM domain-containing protein